ncbi:MAG: protein translocase subunit SecD, partial [Pseudomonadota bacterium]
MLNFPLWKVGLILVILVWGTILALPNMFSDGFLGIEPREPSDPTNEVAMAAYEQQLQESEDSWWFLPAGKLNLGLDLQGGVYLLMEIDPAEIAANRLETVQADIRTALNRNPLVERNPPIQNEDRLTIEILNPEEDMDEAIRRLNRINPTIGTTQTELFTVRQTGDQFIQLTVPNGARTALA